MICAFAAAVLPWCYCYCCAGSPQVQWAQAEVRRALRAVRLLRHDLREAQRAASGCEEAIMAVCAGLPGGHVWVAERVQEACQMTTQHCCAVCDAVL